MANIGFTALIKSKGYNQKSLAEETGIPVAVLESVVRREKYVKSCFYSVD